MKNTNVKTFLRNSLHAALGLALGSTLAMSAQAGWSVNGTKVIDPNGNNFIYRGINHAHSWYTSTTTKALSDIAATGANSVRVVLSNGTQWTRNGGADVANIISLCKANKLVCVLEVHDSTGYGEQSSATNISKAAEYWVSSDIKNAIIGQEDYVIVNIANEPYGNNTSAATYTNETIAAIKTLRNAGLTHQIMVDAPAWGQDWAGAMRDNANTIFQADSLSNTLFSVHMYEVYNNATTIQNYLTSFQATGRALIVGEFGTENNGNNVDEASILSLTQQMGIGYMGWSWSGNGGCCTALDIVINFDPANLSTWGNFLLNSANGIKATSRLATNYGGTTTTSSSSSSKTSSSVATSTSSSVKTSSSVATSSSSSVSGGEQCNWYGQLYPLCATTTSGWGYENNKSCIARATCASQPAPYGIVGSATSSSVATSVATSTSSKTSSSVAPSTSSATSTSSSVATSVATSSKTSSSSSSAASGGISCSYVVSNAWGTGFTGAIRVTNNGTSALNGWTASWQYSGANRLTSSWNATVTGSNPYSATNLAWNGSVGAGQTVEFGFQGNTNGGSVETPVVSCK